MEPVVISKKLLKRLPLYLAHLKALPENSNVSATSMARYLGLGEYQPSDYTRGLYYRGVE